MMNMNRIAIVILLIFCAVGSFADWSTDISPEDPSVADPNATVTQTILWDNYPAYVKKEITRDYYQYNGEYKIGRYFTVGSNMFAVLLSYYL